LNINSNKINKKIILIIESRGYRKAILRVVNSGAG